MNVSQTDLPDAISQDIVKLIFNDQSSLLKNALGFYPQLIDRLDINARSWMHHAAESGSWGCMEVLKQQGLDVNLQDISGETPLHRASSSNHQEAVQWLLVNGANPNIKNRHGATPVLYAAEWDADAVQTLVLSGGDPNVVDKSNDGIEQWASRDSFVKRTILAREAASSSDDTKPRLKM